MSLSRGRSMLVIAVLAVGACDNGSDVADAGAQDLSAAQATPDLATASELGHVTFTDMDPQEPPPDLAAPLSFQADPMPYGADRLAEMAKYSLDHYGDSTSVLAPQLIVLHFTDGPTWTSAYNLFVANTPNRGELPGTCAHYIVEQDGVIHALVDPSIRCRHAVGVNHVAVGIEIVQDSMGKGGAWADQQILARAVQIDSVLHLTHWLQAKYGIATDHVIGHAMANASPYFKDLEGWTNDHDDWLEADVVEVRKRLDALP